MRLEDILRKPEAQEQMRKVENAVALTCTQFRENTEALIVVFALVRVATRLLGLYNPSTRKTMIDNVLAPKMHAGVEDADSSGLILQ